MKRLLTFSILIALVMFFASCSSGDAKTNDESAESDSSKVENSENGKKDGSGWNAGGDEGPVAIPVEVTELVTGSISNYLQYSSTLETEQTVNVFSRIGGLVEAIYVEESDRVRKGARLVQIEKDEYVLEEQRARLEYDKLLADYNRLKALEAENLLSKEEYFNAEVSMKQAKIAWEQAKLNLKYTTVTAPISGVVGDRMVNLGDRIQTTSNLFTIANLDDKIVRTYVPQSEFANCYKNQVAIITSDALPGEKFSGSVKRISPIVDPQSGTFKVTVGVKDRASRLRPGMFVNVELVVDTHEDALLMPKSALIYENERAYFYVVQGDSSLKVELDKGFEDAEKIEVKNDLDIGAKVVVLGQNGLKEGSKVKIIQEKSYPWQGREKEKISAAF